MAASEYNTFSEVRARLDEIVVEVRKKDLSLEASLDLYEEAIQHCNRAAELVDKPDFSDEEIAQARAELDAMESGDQAADEAGQSADDQSEAAKEIAG